MDLDFEHLIKLTESGQEDEAVKIIRSYFDNASEEEKGESYVAIGSLYLQMLSEEQEKMAMILEEQLKQLKALDRHEKVAMEKINLEELRGKLQK